MSFFTWDPVKLSVKVDAMDKEHQKLIVLMNKLHEKHTAKASKQDVKSALVELATFTKQHFDSEEKFFDTLPYTKAASHKMIHKELLKRVGEFAAEFEAKGVPSDELFRFLKVWLTSHIAGVDAQYGQVANKKAA